MAPTDFHSTAACVITSCSFDIFLSFVSGLSYFSSNVVLEEQAVKNEADINNRKLQKSNAGLHTAINSCESDVSEGNLIPGQG